MAGLFNAWEFEIALRYLRNRRKYGGVAVISILSFIGIFLSVTSLITITSAMRGLQAHQMETFFTFKYHAVVTPAPGSDARDRLQAVRRVAGVVQASAFITRPALIQTKVSATSAEIFGMDPQAAVSRMALQRKLIAGDLSALSGAAECAPKYSRCVVIGEGLARQLDVLPGEPVTIVSPQAVSVSYRASGIFRSGDPKVDGGHVFMPLSQAQELFGRGEAWDGIGVVLADPYALERPVALMRAVMGKGAKVVSWEDSESALWDALNIERVAMQVILYFVVLISALNIVAGLTMLVKNKTKDIGILRTMGCSRSAVTRIFFISGMMIGGLATCCGFVAGALLVSFMQPLQRLLDVVLHVRLLGYGDIGGGLVYVPAEWNAGEALTIFVSSLLLSAVCTLFPAMSAARLDPVTAVADG